VADGFLPLTTFSGFLITPFFLLPGYNKQTHYAITKSLQIYPADQASKDMLLTQYEWHHWQY